MGKIPISNDILEASVPLPGGARGGKTALLFVIQNKMFWNFWFFETKSTPNGVANHTVYRQGSKMPMPISHKAGITEKAGGPGRLPELR